MEKVIIFGINDFAELAHYYLETDSDYKVVAFSVTKDYLPEEKEFKELPVIAFEDIELEYSPEEYKFFAPMAPKKINSIRKGIYIKIKEKGYAMISYVSSKASIFNTKVGDNCFIQEDNTIQPFVSIGNNVILWSGNHIGHHSVIKDHVFFSSHVVLSGHCVVEPSCFFGVNSTIKDGVIIAEGSFVSMATSITANTNPWGVYIGNPSKERKLKSNELWF